MRMMTMMTTTMMMIGVLPKRNMSWHILPHIQGCFKLYSAIVPRTKELNFDCRNRWSHSRAFRWTLVLPVLHSKANSHTQKMCPQGIPRV